MTMRNRIELANAFLNYNKQFPQDNPPTEKKTNPHTQAPMTMFEHKPEPKATTNSTDINIEKLTRRQDW